MGNIIVRSAILASLATTAHSECLQEDASARLACYDAVAGYQAPSTTTQGDGLTFNDIEHLFGKQVTDARRDRNEESYQYAQVSASGTVEDVSSPGFLSKDYSVRIKGPGEVDVVCKIAPSMAKLALDINLGGLFTCTGPARNVITTFGSTTVFVAYRP